MVTKPKTERPWAELSREEKREARFKRWLSVPGGEFSSPAAAEGYRARVTRLIDAISLREPDRVPCILPAGQFPAYYAGITLRTAMYDYGEMKRAWLKYLREFEGDTFAGPGLSSAIVSEILDSKTSKWPGHGLPDNASIHQYVEGEYMKADEYDALIKDPSDYCFRVYLSRTMGAFEPFKKVMPFRHILGMPANFLGACTRPDVQAAFQAVIDAGKELARFRAVVGEISREARAAGFPAFMGGGAHAPFDIFADTLRGTQGIVMDMYRQPDKLIEAMEAVIPWIIEAAIDAANASGGPIIFFALHKGDDTFMSDMQFEKFYWPYLKKVIMGVVEEGGVPLLFAEGAYNRRLEVIRDLPRGSVIW